MGVFGSWGAGKTSLLLMLADRLQRTEDEPAVSPVWFNAWQYSEEGALRRALLSRVLEELRGAAEGEVSELDDLQAALYRNVDREELGNLEIDWKGLAESGVKGAVKFGLSYIPGISFLNDLVSVARRKTDNWAEGVLDSFRREKTRIHLDRIKFLEKFRDRFRRLVETHLVDRGQRLVVFVDDLDRRLPEKAVDVLGAIKLFLDVEGCVFVIAADRKVIAEGIRVKYKDFALHDGKETELPIKGDDYLEKLIQLPFHLPPVTEDQSDDFISKEASDLPERCARVLSIGLETNPRKIKRALRSFWFHDRLAERRKDLREGIEPVLCAKVVVIQTRYPDLYSDWVGAPLLLRHLEEHLSGQSSLPESDQASEVPTDKPEEDLQGLAKGIAEPRAGHLTAPTSALVRKWADVPTLCRMMLHGAGEKDTGFAGMAQDDLETYIYLTRTTAVRTEDAGGDVDEQTWEALLSGDRTRIESAVGRIDAEQRGGYVRRLMEVIGPRDEQEAAQRVSAGDALASLGDPRFREGACFLPAEPLLGFVELPAGPFLMGSDKGRDGSADDHELPQHEVVLPMYYLGRYPVTVAQFQAFVDETGFKPGDEDCLRGVPNHPVARVSWHEALAYCDWLTKGLRESADTPDPLAELLREESWSITLPSEAEWEKGARGAEGRIYPWGDEADPNRANYGDTNIGTTSAVGCFPGGASPYGLLDMGGNVWEWTRSQLKDYPYVPDDAREDVEGAEGPGRVLRGGAFSDSGGGARCAFRYWYGPRARLNYVGFRLCASPFQSL